ncbi:MAG: hypothetical protein MJ223_00735 [Mycoplasmoidaceae bacterium]|nr:hypothetical protein [Mycoplasmoidaceae bacterium]
MPYSTDSVYEVPPLTLQFSKVRVNAFLITSALIAIVIGADIVKPDNVQVPSLFLLQYVLYPDGTQFSDN